VQQHPNMPQAHPLKFRNLVHGSGGPRMAINEVVDDREELEEYAQDCVGEDDRAAIAASTPRFEREKVIAVALGQRPTAAWTVEIVAVTQITGGFVGIQTRIDYVERGPSGPATPPDALAAPGYPHHLVRVKNVAGVVTFRRIPDVTTLAVGEEGPPVTTMAVGEEAPAMTTMMLGEEGPPVTTMAVGEEGGAWAGGRVAAARRMSPEDPSTAATGEEGGDPTTLATGEESAGMLTMGGFEDPIWMGPDWWWRVRGGGGWGGGPFGGF